MFNKYFYIFIIYIIILINLQYVYAVDNYRNDNEAFNTSLTVDIRKEF